jgi:hypothetical protein
MLLLHHGKSDRRGNNLFKVKKAEFYNIGKRHERRWDSSGGCGIVTNIDKLRRPVK